MEAVMSHPFILLSCNCICLLLWGPVFIMTERESAKHVGRNVKWCQRKAAGEFVKGGHVVNNQSVLLCADLGGYLEQVSHTGVCV